jgi:Type II secretory pathway, component PulF
MNKPWYFMPFIYVYKLVFFVVSLPFKLLNLLLKGFIKTSQFIYRVLMKNFIFGIYVMLFLLKKLIILFFTAISYILAKTIKYCKIGIKVLFKYAFVCLILPLELARNKAISNRRKKKTERFILNYEKEKINKKRQEENIKKLEQLKLAKEQEALSKQKKLAAKREEKESKKTKNKAEVYINENVVIEKEKIGDKVGKGFKSLLRSPLTLLKGFNKKLGTGDFAKAKRNADAVQREILLIDFDGDDAIKSESKRLYEYVAKNAEGQVIKDYFEAFSKVEVHSFLLSEGYEVYSIRTSKTIEMFHRNRSTSKTKIKTKDLIFFLTQLSTYLKAGIPLAECLKILSRQFKKKSYRKIFESIIYDLTMGEVFSDSLAKQGEAFPRLLINMVKTAEMTGELPETLDDMEEYFTEQDKTRKQMITALMYPLLVLTFAMGVVVFILVWVIPRFTEIYESMDASAIPAFTKAVIAVSNFLKAYGIFVLIGIILAIMLVRWLYKNIKMVRTYMQWLFMHIPVMSTVMIYNEVTTFTKTFSNLLKHNVFITDSMEILNKITNNEIYKMLILDTITNIAKGDKISLAFKDHWAFPIPAYEMLVTGEKTGQLPDMMAKVAAYYQEQHTQAVTRIKTFVEPILIIFLTVVVGTIILAIILPMFGMYDMVG